jgi:hypothetical protein
MKLLRSIFTILSVRRLDKQQTRKGVSEGRNQNVETTKKTSSLSNISELAFMPVEFTRKEGSLETNKNPICLYCKGQVFFFYLLVI